MSFAFEAAFLYFSQLRSRLEFHIARYQMNKKFWLGVASSADIAKAESVQSWWCLPPAAAPGDRILFYCPRSTSLVRQGIFAEAEVTSQSSSSRAENCYCSGYKTGTIQLGYVDIEIVERFTRNLTAATMKRDSILSRSAIVKKNFQGTTFQLDIKTYERIKLVLGTC